MGVSLYSDTEYINDIEPWNIIDQCLFDMCLSLLVSTDCSQFSWGYVDACKIVKGLEPKFGHFVTKAAVIPEAPIETTGPQEETKVASKKGSKKKKTKKEMALNLFCGFSQV